MTIFNIFMLTTIVLIKNKHTVFTEAALWPIPSAPPMPPSPPPSQDRDREEGKETQYHLLVERARSGLSFVTLGKLLTALTLRFLICNMGIIIALTQQGDSENQMLINSSNAIRTVCSTWYKAFSKRSTEFLGLQSEYLRNSYLTA